VPMLIGIDASRTVTTRRTGTEYYSLRLIQALLALESPHKFRLYFNRFHADGFSGVDSQGAELRVIPLARLWTHIRLGIEVARRPPDVLFVPAHVLPLSTRVPAVATVHDLGYRYFPDAHLGANAGIWTGPHATMREPPKSSSLTRRRQRRI
jgi:hypothetical protein